MENEVVRRLEDGPDYAPDWRAQVVQIHLSDIAKAPDGKSRLSEILFSEKDPFVRQFLRFRFDGRSVNAEAFKYAQGCQMRNRTTAAASMIKAMVVADRTSAEIAEELGTSRWNIETFMRIFFDVGRYLGNEVWLLRIVTAEPPEGVGEAEVLREKRWLSAAFHRGWAGVEQVVFHRAPKGGEAVEQQLLASLGSRALEYVEDLELSGARPSEEDLRRFLTARNAQSRQPPAAPDSAIRATEWIRALHATMEEKAMECDDPDLEIYRELKAARGGAAQAPPVRRRRRFAGA